MRKIIKYRTDRHISPHEIVRRHLADAKDHLRQCCDIEGEALDITLRDAIRDVLAKVDA